MSFASLNLEQLLKCKKEKDHLETAAPHLAEETNVLGMCPYVQNFDEWSN